MRTREEQIQAFVDANQDSICHEDYRPDDLRMMLNAAIQEAEQRVRAEIGNDRIALPTYEVFCNSAKYLMSGEFSIITHIQCCECGGSGIEEENIEDGTDVLCEACAGEGEITVEHLIPWGTIKQIYRSIVSKYGPKPAIDAARNGGE